MVQIVPRLGSAPFQKLGRPPVHAAIAPAPPPLPAGTEGMTDIDGLLQVLRRNLWRIVLATLAGVVLSLAYLSVAKPMYTATASLFVDPRARKIVSEEIVQGGVASDLALVESQVSILTSDAVLGRVIKDLQLDKDEEYAPRPRQGLLSRIKGLIFAKPPALDLDPAVQAINTLADSIKVKRAQKTYVVDVDVTASSPIMAQRVAQAVVDAYLADQTAAKTTEAKRANALIDARLGELRQQVRDAETRSDEFKRANRILTSEGGIITEQQLSKLNTELITARAVAAESKARNDQILSSLKTDPGAESLPDAVRSGLIQKLREQYSQVARREAALSSQLQPRHPVLVEVRSQLAEVKAQIKAELKRVATAAQAEHQIAESRERELAAQLERAKEEVRRTDTAQIKLRELEQEVTASRELLKLFLARAKETQEQQNVSTPDARIITPPSVPAKPSKPLTWLIISLGLIGGLGLGLASALISDHFDTTVRTAGGIAPGLPAHTVASVPMLNAPRRALWHRWRRNGPARVEAAQFSDLLTAVADYNDGPHTPYRQSILRLLTRVKAHQQPGRPYCVFLASPTAQSGNSATALSLAYAAALAGDRILLIDATSSRPDLSNIFASSLEHKTAVVLDNKEHLAALTSRDARSGLSLLPLAFVDLRTLKSQQRRRLIAGLNSLVQSYDLVVIDAGAVLDDESALSLLPAADEVLLVTRYAGTTRGEIAQALEVLEPARDRLTGAVLTMKT